MLRLAGDFGLLVHDADIKLRILLAFALVPQPDDPSLDRYADDLRNFVGDDIEMRREDLVRA
jgi:hypothetical protein